ncbi:MAG: hypothetical protein R3B70_28835 [Polyangiaceae bacterium]
MKSKFANGKDIEGVQLNGEKTVKYIRATLEEDMARLTIPTPSS